MIPIKDACEILDTNSTSICVLKKFKPFYHGANGKRNGARFDIQGYRKREDFKVELVAVIGLFIEYMNKVEGWTYEQIARAGRINTHQQVNNHELGYRASLQMALRFRYAYPFHFKRFHEFYGWEHIATDGRIKWKTR